MFEIKPNGVNRVDLTISGAIDAEQMRLGLEQLIDKSERIEKGKMLYTISDIDFPTLGAVGVELAKLPQLFKLLGKFDRIAVVADQHWIQRASEIEGFLIPGLEIKAFDRADLAAAEAWLAG
jgi:hypothetical protein